MSALYTSSPQGGIFSVETVRFGFVPKNAEKGDTRDVNLLLPFFKSAEIGR